MPAATTGSAMDEGQGERTSTTQRPSSNPAYQPPGRIGNPHMELRSEPRLHSRVRETLASLGADINVVPPSLKTLSAKSTLDEIAKAIEQSEAGAMALYDSIPLSVPEDESEIEVDRIDEVIPGGDGQQMKVYIYHPRDHNSPLPCVLHLHGGAMTIIPTMNRVHERWCRSLAAHGVVVALVDFRNAWTREKFNHFPAGLDDCVAAVHWLHSAQDRLGISSIILEGDSGGANLAFATTIKAKREGWINKISGVYGSVPYISNAYGWSNEEKLQLLPSLVECDGYLYNMRYTAFMAHFYTPKTADKANPLAWPYYASTNDMKGLPPHVIVVDELDPFRDEGLSYARRLVEAGVSVKSSVNVGVPHGTTIALRATVPELNMGIVWDITSFAKSL